MIEQRLRRLGCGDAIDELQQPDPRVDRVGCRDLLRDRRVVSRADLISTGIKPRDEAARDFGKGLVKNLVEQLLDLLEGTRVGDRARQVVGEAGVVRLISRAGASGEVVVEVEDNGTGIDAEIRRKVFTNFFWSAPVMSRLMSWLAAPKDTSTARSRISATARFRSASIAATAFMWLS